MNTITKILCALPGFALTLIGILWVIDPNSAAEALNMTLLDSVGRSSQIGDGGAYFLFAGPLLLMGIYHEKSSWLHGVALLIGLTAIMRTVAWLFHGAVFASETIIFEIVIVSICLWCAKRFSNSN